MTVHEAIKNVRVERGLSVNDLAEKMGVSSSAIWRYENTDCRLSKKKLEKIAACLNTELKNLVSNDPQNRYMVADQLVENVLTPEESAMVHWYRNLPISTQAEFAKMWMWQNVGCAV